MKEEIKDALEKLEYFEPEDLIECAMYRNCLEKLQGLLDLYKKEKEKNKELEKYKKYYETEKVVWSRKNYINKDKIKEALGIEEDVSEEKLLSLLETLISENNRLEDIEDKKVQVDYERVFAKGVKSVKDKIREKIEEYDKMINAT